MMIERSRAECTAPFPHAGSSTPCSRYDTPAADANHSVAHVLATCAGFAYADAVTVSTMMLRAGLESNACVRISQTVDAMMIFSTAYVVQSRCGRVVVSASRHGAGHARQLAGDADVGDQFPRS
jgi:hypothetical protein